jgi:hypothetical protein
LKSVLAKRIRATQQSCLSGSMCSDHSRRFAFYSMTNHGLGSDLHTWSQAMCVAMEHNVSLVVRSASEWVWSPRELLDRGDLGHHAMDSLFTYFADETEGKHCPCTPAPDAFRRTHLNLLGFQIQL